MRPEWYRLVVRAAVAWVLATIVLFAAMLMFSHAAATPGDAPCSHGNSGHECKPDPQPDHGKDCDQPNGDGNEDHCGGTPTPTPTPSVSVDPSPSPDPSPSVTVSPSPDPATQTPAPTTDPTTGPGVSPSPTGQPPAERGPSGNVPRLAETGPVFLAGGTLLGLLALAVGFALRALGKAREE